MMWRRRNLPKRVWRNFFQILDFLKKQIAFNPRSEAYKVHLIVGESQVGKTSLLYNSELSFRFYKKLATCHQHNTINWWLTRDQLFLDFPGSALVNEGQCAEWLTMIKKSGLAERLASCCWVVRAQDILQDHHVLATSESWQRFCRLCQKILGDVPSMQLVISHCDYIVGFNEFFTTHSEQLLSKPLGYTLPANWDANAIRQSHQELVNYLNQHLLTQLHDEPSTQRQLAMKDFVSQFQKLLEHLELGLLAFKRHMPSQNILTGVFVTGQASSEHQLLNDPVLSYVLPKQPVMDTSHARQVRTSLKWIVMVGIIAIAAIAALLAWQLQSISKTIHKLDTDLQHYHALQQDTDSMTDHVHSLQYLKKARQKLAYLKNDQWTQIYHQPLHRLSTRVQKANQQLVHQLRPVLQKTLEQVLRHPNNPAATYACLSAYLMLQQKMPLEQAYFQQVIKYLTHHDQEQGGGLTPTVAKALRHALQTNTHDLLGQQRYDKTLVNHLKQQFNELSSAQQAHLILSSYFINSDPLTLNLPQSHRGYQLIHLKDKNAPIKPLYSLDAWQQIQKNHLLAKTALVIHQGNAIAKGDSKTAIAQLAKSLKQRYFQQYAQNWQQFRTNVVLRQPHTLKQAQKAIRRLNSQPSIMIQLAQLFNGQIPQPVKPYLDDKTQSLLHSITTHQAALQNLNQNLGDLQHYLAGANDQHQAFKLTKQRMLNDGQGDALSQLIDQLNQVPDYWQSWVKHFAHNTWELLLKSSAQYINQQWRNTIWPAYQHQLQKRFPFRAQADQTVKPYNFKAFFAPHRKMSHFFQHYLVPFIDTQHKQWQFQSLNGKHLPLKQHTLHLFHQSDRISQQLFNSQGDFELAIDLQLSPQAQGLNSVLLQWPKQTLRLSVPAKKAFKHMQRLVWHHEQEHQQLKVTYITARGQKHQHNLQGFWSLWRWLSHYQTHTIKTHYWRLEGNSGVYQYPIVLHFKGQQPMFNASYFQNLPFRSQL